MRLAINKLWTAGDGGFLFLLRQSAITCSKLTIEILEQGVEYVQS